MSTHERAVGTLDSLIRRLLCSGWDEGLRQQAISAAARLASLDAARGPRQTRKICRGILSLLALQGADVEQLRGDIGARLLELLACLQEVEPARDLTPRGVR